MSNERIEAQTLKRTLPDVEWQDFVKVKRLKELAREIINHPIRFLEVVVGVGAEEANCCEYNFTELIELQDKFDNALGITNGQHQAILYNPVFDYWSASKTSENEFPAFRNFIFKQWETSLRERYGVAESIVEYSFIGGKVYNKNFPNEPFNVVLQRGRFYRESEGSREIPREKMEIEGCEKATKILLSNSPKSNDKIVIISGNGITPGSIYNHNFIDIYQVLENGGIQMTRRKCSLGYKEYVQIALMNDEHYFDNWEGPLDAWFLSNPIRVTKKIEDVFGIPEEQTTEEEFQNLLSCCLPSIDLYFEQICAKTFNPIKIAESFNRILSAADKFVDLLNGADSSSFGEEQNGTRGVENIREIKAGCGFSRGFSLENVLLRQKIGDKVPVQSNVLEKSNWIYEEGCCRKPILDDEGNKIGGGCGKHSDKIGPCGLCKSCEEKYN